MFDVETAIATAIENRPKSEREQWERMQREGKRKLKKQNANTIYALRAITLAEDALEKGEDVAFNRERLAEGYFLLGEFEKACEYSDKYKDYLEALNNSKCDCKPHQKDERYHFIKMEFPSFKIKQCANCLRMYA